jgi:hypothetical protein
MMRICPKCGDYYADALLAFCLVDGTPLVKVAPLSENWSEGTRVIEEKEKTLRRRKRRLKWRRVLLSAMTMLIAIMVVCVVVVNSFIYLKPKQAEVVLATPSTPPTAPAEPVVSIIPSALEKTSPTPSPSPTQTGTPKPVYKISGRVTDGSKALGGVSIRLVGAKTISMRTDANGNYTFSHLLAGGSYTITPDSAKIDFTPHSRSIKNLTQDRSADFVGTVQPECSVADESLERETILNTFRSKWRRNIEGDKRKILAENRPNSVANANGLIGVANVEAILGEIKYEIRFPKVCRASVTARYVWQVKTQGTFVAQGTVKAIPKEKRFACAKTGATWLCG